MAYNQQQDLRRIPQQRYYNEFPQEQRAPERDRDAYVGQSRRNNTYNQHEDPARIEASGYDQYGGNPYAAAPSFTGYENNHETGAAALPAQMQSRGGYANGYDGGDVNNSKARARQGGPSNTQRIVPPSAPLNPTTYEAADVWQSQQRAPRMPPGGSQVPGGGSHMPRRLPEPYSRPQGNNDPYAQASASRSRPVQQNPSFEGRQRAEQSPRRPLRDPYPTRDEVVRRGPDYGRPEMQAPQQTQVRNDQQHSLPQRERTLANARPFDGPGSPQQRNFDNPFPVFSSAKQGGQPDGRILDERSNPPETGRYSQEIYNGIVGDYMNEDQHPEPREDRTGDQRGRTMHTHFAPPQQQRPPPNSEYQSRQRPPPKDYSSSKDRGPESTSSYQRRPPQTDNRGPLNPPAWNDQAPPPLPRPGPQFTLPTRPGTAPGAPAGALNRPLAPDENPYLRNHDIRPPPDRSMSDRQMLNTEYVPAFHNANFIPGDSTSANIRPNLPVNYERLGSDASRQFPPRDLLNHQHNYSEPAAGQGAPAQRQFRGQGGAMMEPTMTQNRAPDWGPRPGSSRAVDPNYPRAQGPPPDQRMLAQSQMAPPIRSFSNESQNAIPGPRFINDPAAPRSQSPMRQPPPHMNSIPTLAQGTQMQHPPGGNFAQSFEQLPRPSMDRADGSSTGVLQSKRSAAHLPNRANVERPTFYPATGHITHSPTISVASLSKERESPSMHAHVNERDGVMRQPLRSHGQGQHQNNPDALPYHATPLRADGQPEQLTSQPPPRPPPIRQYQKDPAPAANAPPTGRRPSVPVTQEELSRLREIVRTQPSDSKAQLILAKKLGEAAHLSGASGGSGVNSLKLNARDQERFNTEAYKLVKKLVSNEYMDAMFYLAECYGDGTLGLANNPKEAFILYQSAAKLGHASAAYRTAVCCEIGPDDGGGTRKDLQKAFQWYKRASALGDVPATYKMGIILLKGLLGQEKSLGEAVGYLKRAADRADEENPHALHELGLLYESPKNPGLIVRDEAQALSLFTKAAKLGYKFSQFKLGQSYEYGLLGCKVDARNSIIWYTKAAAQGEHQSELALSGWYLTGSEGILEHSDTEAYLWARKAALAEPPLPKAMFAMGYFTEVGIGCPRSLEEAKRWYGRAAAYKFPKAQEHLEELQRGGSKVQKNREKLSRSNPKQDADCALM